MPCHSGRSPVLPAATRRSSRCRRCGRRPPRTLPHHHRRTHSAHFRPLVVVVLGPSLRARCRAVSSSPPAELRLGGPDPAPTAAAAAAAKSDAGPSWRDTGTGQQRGLHHSQQRPGLDGISSGIRDHDVAAVHHTAGGRNPGGGCNRSDGALLAVGGRAASGCNNGTVALVAEAERLPPIRLPANPDLQW